MPKDFEDHGQPCEKKLPDQQLILHGLLSGVVIPHFATAKFQQVQEALFALLRRSSLLKEMNELNQC